MRIRRGPPSAGPCSARHDANRYPLPMRHTLLTAGAFLAALGCSSTTDHATTEASATVENPVELGRVRWERDHAEAVARARREDRDVLMLFQEVPG